MPAWRDGEMGGEREREMIKMQVRTRAVRYTEFSQYICNDFAGYIKLSNSLFPKDHVIRLVS